MEKRIALLAVVLMVMVNMSGSTALALSPMGPPKALLGQEQWAVGVEYTRHEMDLQTFGPVDEIHLVGGVPTRVIQPYYLEYNIEDLKSNMFMGRAAYGIHDNWNIFLRLGAADAKGDISEVLADGSRGDQYRGFDGSYGFAWGFGTRATFWRDGDLTWGGLFQITWAEPDGSNISCRNDPNFSGDAELDFREIQVAVGPTLQLDDLQIYGGPFLHFLKGDLDVSGETVDSSLGVPLDMRLRSSHDIREESQFGGYAGAQWDMNKDTSVYAEYQITGDAWGVGVGVIRKFR